MSFDIKKHFPDYDPDDPRVRPCDRCNTEYSHRDDFYCPTCESCQHCGCCPCGKPGCEYCPEPESEEQDSPSQSCAGEA